MVMPHELTPCAADVVHRVHRRCPLPGGFPPPPAACNRIILRGIRGQVFEHHPGVLGEKPLDGTALVHRGLLQAQDQEGLGQALRELRQQRQQARRCATCGPLPLEALGASMPRATQGGTLTLRGRRDVALVAFAQPAAWDVGFMGHMGCIDTKDCSGPLGVARLNGGAKVCPPRFVCSAVGALRGMVGAKRWEPPSPACSWRRTVASLPAA